jgi:hypothetical protein
VGGGHVLAGEARLSMGERLVVAVICAGFVGCNSAPLGKANSDGGVVRVPPSQSAVGAKSRVPAGEAHLGFASGSVKADVNLKAFDISKLPVSEAQLAECRAAGACDARATSCTSASPAPDEPALCVEPETARSYCAWVGGRLPRLAEWLVAARGPDIRRFAWGSTSPSCQQHPRGTLKQPAATNSDKSVRDLRDSGLIADRTEHLNGGPTEREVELPCTEAPTPASFRVGSHPLATSPSGMQDALLAPAELLDADPDALLPACHTGACLVYGLVPAAIDAVRPYVATQQLAGDEPYWSTVPPDHAHALRCVWEVGS